jgi:hypothetical protein
MTVHKMCGVWAVWKRFGLAAVIITAAWFIAVFSLNQTLFSPGGYVLSYLDALERGEFGEASARAGLSEIPTVLPRPDARVSEPRIAGMFVTNPDEVVVQAQYLFDGAPSESLFTLTRLPRTLGLFDRWQFAELPVGTITVTIIGSEEVTLNGVTVSRDVSSQGLDVLYPGQYTVSWSSGWLSTDTVDVTLDGDQSNTVRLVAVPTEALIEQAKKAVTEYLTSCTSQAVLQPASCPFGVTITDRVMGDVDWEITTEPRVVLAMFDDEKTWQVQALGGEATLTVSLQSLFDGTVSDFVETQTIDVTGIIEGLDVNRPRFIVD